MAFPLVFYLSTLVVTCAVVTAVKGECVDGPFNNTIPAGGLSVAINGKACVNEDEIKAEPTCKGECKDGEVCHGTGVTFKTVVVHCGEEVAIKVYPVYTQCTCKKGSCLGGGPRKVNPVPSCQVATGTVKIGTIKATLSNGATCTNDKVINIAVCAGACKCPAKACIPTKMDALVLTIPCTDGKPLTVKAEKHTKCACK